MVEKRKNDINHRQIPWQIGFPLSLIGIGLFGLGVLVGMWLNENGILVINPTGTVKSQAFTVDATGEWQNTGLRVEQDDVVTISYQSGKWRSIPNEPFYGPDGGSSYICQRECLEPLPGYPKGGLIGRIGSGSPFPVGSEYEDTMVRNGMLQLRINDPGIFDNEGSITVLISIHGAKT